MSYRFKSESTHLSLDSEVVKAIGPLGVRVTVVLDERQRYVPRTVICPSGQSGECVLALRVVPPEANKPRFQTGDRLFEVGDACSGRVLCAQEFEVEIVRATAPRARLVGV